MSNRFFRWQGLHVAVDRRPQVLHLAMDPMATWQEMRRHATRRPRTQDDIDFVEYDHRARFEAPLYPSIAAMPEDGAFVSASVLAQKAKVVDDVVVAALELLLDEGAAGLHGRGALLADVQDVLRAEWNRCPDDSGRAEAIGLLSAARALAGDDDPDAAAWPAALRLRRVRHLREFRKQQDLDVPLGVYSWSDRLAGLYRQGKALQGPLAAGVATALAGVLESVGGLRRAYEAHLDLLALTNPLVGPGVLSGRQAEEGPGHEPALFPASETPEGRLVKRLIGMDTVPPGFDLIGELIARVGDGRITLEPTPESGWYDHVLHALEPLINPDRAPEAGKLRLAESYRDDLKDLFRALLGFTRESHVKQIEMAVAGGYPPLLVAPQLTFEPLAEHYRRRAASYRFVRERLVDRLGEDVLLSRSRLTPRGEAGVSLLDELVVMEQLYTGAWAVALDELGMAPEADRGRLLAAEAAARRWASLHRADPDLAEDVRMMVPLFKDIWRGELHVLAVVGYEQRNLEVQFAEHPTVIVSDGRGRAVGHEVLWSSATYPLARPVTVTCRTRRLLDRCQFRALCDREGSATSIRRALERDVSD